MLTRKSFSSLYVSENSLEHEYHPISLSISECIIILFRALNASLWILFFSHSFFSWGQITYEKGNNTNEKGNNIASSQRIRDAALKSAEIALSKLATLSSLNLNLFMYISLKDYNGLVGQAQMPGYLGQDWEKSQKNLESWWRSIR